MRKLLALVAPLAVAGVMAAAAYGFMAANTVEPHLAGYGAGKVTGFHVFNSYYQWFFNANSSCDGCTPQVWAVGYDISPRPDSWLETWFTLDGGSTTHHDVWYPGNTSECSVSDAGADTSFVFCTFYSPNVPLEKIVKLDVAAENFPD